MIRRALPLVIALAFVIGAGASPSVAQDMAAGASETYACPTTLTVIPTGPNEVRIECAAPIAAPTPIATASPSPVPTASPSPSPVPTATASPSVQPTPGTSANVSGIPIRAALPGYTRHHATEFPNTSALGNGLHSDTARYFDPRPSGPGDCQYGDSSGRGIYCAERTIEEVGGLLRHWLHTEQQADCRNPVGPVRHVGTGNCNYVSGLLWNVPHQREFVISFVARFDDIPGRKVAFLRWCGPRIGTAGYCEDNYPEGKLEPGLRGNAFHHHEGTKSQTGKQLNIDFNAWHEYRMHVKPGKFVDFYLDGQLVLHATTGVTDDPSYFVFQSETYLKGQAIPEPDNAGWLEFDWYTLDLPSD